MPWDHAGLVWHGKRPKAGNGKRMEIEMENGPTLDGGKTGKKMAKKWMFEGVLHYFPFLGHFFAIFSPVQLGAVFHFDFHFFFFHFRLLAVFHAIPARHDPKARLQSEVGTEDFFRGTNFLMKNAPKFCPKMFSLYFVGPKKSRKIPAKFPDKFPSPK